jgi:hypothetical protein
MDRASLFDDDDDIPAQAVAHVRAAVRTGTGS